MTLSPSQPPFEITIDRVAHLMRITFGGNWTVETVDQLRQATRKEVARLVAGGCRAKDLLILMDRRNQGPHSQEVVEALKLLSAENSGKAKRVALLMSSALATMQAKRINAGTTRVFTSEAEALEWLAIGREGS